MTPHELRERTRRFAVEIIRFSASVPATVEGRVVRMQLVRAGTAVGANYRAACRSRSNRDFIAKLGLVIEEVDETSYWLEILVEADVVTRNAAEDLRREADELTRIFVRSRQTARKHVAGAANPEP